MTRLAALEQDSGVRQIEYDAGGGCYSCRPSRFSSIGWRLESAVAICIEKDWRHRLHDGSQTHAR